MSTQTAIVRNIREKNASGFLFNYLLLPIESIKTFYPKSSSATVVRDEFKIIISNYEPEYTEEFVDGVVSLWMRKRRIVYCSPDIYKPVFESIKEKKAYTFVKEMKRLAYKRFYTEFPQFQEDDEIKRSWQEIIEHTIFNEQCDEKFYAEITRVWSNYLKHSYLILKKCMLEQNIDRFTNRIYFLTKYGLDLRLVYKNLKQDVPIEVNYHWDNLINIRVKKKTSHEILGEFHNKMLCLLEDLNPFKSITFYLESGNEYDFLLEYFYLSEAGIALKFSLSLNSLNDTMKVWREALMEYFNYESEDFVKKVSVLWLRLIKKLSQKYEYWVDEVMYDLIVFLEQEIAVRENVKSGK
ncbi:MAG: hypothetical protein A2Y40_04605 [Candidatus Margulisbacteria bacterium GWF2_35_9]|nr:MAG: hypothetical protein A2Y40_04605 [Candidatus Margulisbacteria bacterium GWF2_35_9]